MTDRELLETAPLPRVAHETDEETGRVILLKPRFRWSWLTRIMAPGPERRHVKIHLDDLGSWVWLHLDGETPLRELAAGLARDFPGEENPQARLLLFVRQLLGSGLAGIVQRPPEGS